MSLFDKFRKNSEPTEYVEAWKVIVSGTVQGVGFRYSVATLADAMSIPGTVKSNPDGTVTIVLQANKGKVDEFLKDLPHNLSPFAKITNMKVEKLENVGKLHSFRVLY